MNAWQRIEDYASRGFLFHGSPKRLDKLEPRQAFGKHPGECQFAVYASDFPAFALIAAVLRPINPERFRSGWHSDDNVKILVYGNGVELRDGFVHILSPESFETYKGLRDFGLISYTEVRPVEVIPVTPNQLLNLEGITLSLGPLP